MLNFKPRWLFNKPDLLFKVLRDQLVLLACLVLLVKPEFKESLVIKENPVPMETQV